MERRRQVPARRRFLLSASVLALPAVGILTGSNLVPAGVLTIVVAVVAAAPFVVLLGIHGDGEAPGVAVAGAGVVLCLAALFLTQPVLLDLRGEPVRATVLTRESAGVHRATGSTSSWMYTVEGPGGDRIPGEVHHGESLEKGAPIDVVADPGNWAGPSMNSYDGWAVWGIGLVALALAVVYLGAHWSARGAYDLDGSTWSRVDPRGGGG